MLRGKYLTNVDDCALLLGFQQVRKTGEPAEHGQRTPYPSEKVNEFSCDRGSVAARIRSADRAKERFAVRAEDRREANNDNNLI